MFARRQFGGLIMFGLLLALLIGGLAQTDAASTPETTLVATELQSLNSGQHFLPPYGNTRDRFGFDSGGLSGYDVAQLHAGWYSNWGASLNPRHPDRLAYTQLIRFHAGSDPQDPSLVKVYPNRATIAQIAAAHPGSLWMLSNEPDSFYQGDPILPTTYAGIYHDMYNIIKGLDPSALIANGGIIQPTPCRLEYLDIVWDTYLDTYGEPMPVDVWNIHAFVLREKYNSWGVSTPPGVDPSCGIEYAIDDADNIDIFWDNIKAFRAWMKEKGYQDRPLIISEYGILWPQWFAPQFTPARVSQFMVQTFDRFLTNTDLEIGYPADDHRLVQAWAWYSLDDDQQYNGYLFRSDSQAISPIGEAYAAYTAALSDTLNADLSVRLEATQLSLTPIMTGTTQPLAVTVSLTRNVGNLGKLPTTNTRTRLEIVSVEDGSVIFSQDEIHNAPARYGGVVALSPLTVTLPVAGTFELSLTTDPDDEIAESREWNNVSTTIMDFDYDAQLDVTKRAHSDLVQAGSQLTYTIRVTNTGYVGLHATVIDLLPTHVTPGGTEVGTLILPGGTLVWTPVITAPGGIWTKTIVVTVEMGYAGPLTNVVRVATEEGATGIYTETSQAQVTPGLTVVKRATPDPVQAGSPLTYTLRVTNTGNVDLHATIIDMVPAHTAPGGTLISPGGIFTWTPVITAPRGVWAATIVATVEMGYAGPLTNVMRVATAEGATGIYTETSQAQVTPGLMVVKRATPDPVQAGSPLTYTLRVTNTGNVDLHATITDIVPTHTAPGGTLISPGGIFTWTPVITAPRGVWTETIVVSAATGYSGTLTNVVHVATNQGATGIYTETSAAVFTPYLTLDVQPTVYRVVQGESAVYTVTLDAHQGFVSPVDLSVTNPPTNTNAIFASNPLTASASTRLTITTTRLTPEGDYGLQVRATSGNISRARSVRLVVQPFKNYIYIYVPLTIKH